MEKPSTDQSPDQSTTDIPYLDPILIQSIADILTFKPKSTSREVYDLLVACSTGEGCVGESVVEACLIAEFGYSPEDTMRIKTLSAAQRNAIVAKRKVAKLKAISEDEDDEEEEKDHIKDGCICDECVIKPVKAVEALCDCNRPVQIISNVWLDRYRIYKEDKPENSSSVALLSIMLGTASTIKSFLPNDLPDDIQSEHSASLRAGQRVYALFYSEWWAWMGPPFRQMNPKLNYKPGLEADTFEGADLHFDEHKMIYWDPSLPYSFEVHVQKALQFPCGCWRSNFLWLKFALCHTQDRNTVLMLNAVIAGKFGLKCRHLQDGVVEWQSWHGKWFHSFHLTSTEAYVIENAGEEPISWATISPEIPGVAFYYFPPLDVRVGTSFSLDEQTKIKMKDPERYHRMVNAKFIHQVRRRVSYSGLV